jgi:hypothetical protein
MHILFIGLHGITAIYITLYQMKNDNLDSDMQASGRAGYHYQIQGATLNCFGGNEDTNVALINLFVFNASNIINAASTAISESANKTRSFLVITESSRLHIQISCQRTLHAKYLDNSTSVSYINPYLTHIFFIR